MEKIEDKKTENKDKVVEVKKVDVVDATPIKTSPDRPADTNTTKSSENKSENKQDAKKPTSFKRNSFGGQGGNRRHGGFSRGKKKFARVKPEFDQKLLGIRRVTRVVAGGRRFSFSVSMIIGDKKGRVGVGTGKAGDTALAIEKSVKNARKNMITISRTKNNSIPHEIKAKYCSARILIWPASGKGVAAGGALRNILDLVGLQEVGAKILSRSKNKLNIARAGIKALGEIPAPKIVKDKKEDKKEEKKSDDVVKGDKTLSEIVDSKKKPTSGEVNK